MKETFADKQKLKELKKKQSLLRATTLQNNYTKKNANQGLIKRALEYDEISEKTGENSEF